MRRDWNQRALEDANYYVAFGRRDQDDSEFLSTAAHAVRDLEGELKRFPASVPPVARRAPRDRLRPRPPHASHEPPFSAEIDGIDVSDEMIVQATEKLRDIPRAQRAPRQRQRSRAIPCRPLRFYLLLRGVPAHSQRRCCLFLPARNYTCTETRWIRAPSNQWTTKDCRRLHNLGRCSNRRRRNTSFDARSRCSPAIAHRSGHAVYVDLMEEAATVRTGRGRFNMPASAM